MGYLSQKAKFVKKNNTNTESDIGSKSYIITNGFDIYLRQTITFTPLDI